jgi:hypothetical protein
MRLTGRMGIAFKLSIQPKTFMKKIAKKVLDMRDGVEYNKNVPPER